MEGILKTSVVFFYYVIKTAQTTLSHNRILCKKYSLMHVFETVTSFAEAKDTTYCATTPFFSLIKSLLNSRVFCLKLSRLSSCCENFEKNECIHV